MIDPSKILFKAKLIDMDVWIEGYLYVRQELGKDDFGNSLSGSSDYDFNDHYYILDNGDDYGTYFEDHIQEIDPKKLEMYTGRDDINNKKIFTGDYLKVIYEGLIFYGEVVFEKGSFIFGCDKMEDSYVTFIDLEDCYIEIIGDKYDNLGMLKTLLKEE